MTRIVLHQFEGSHYNEKARWALDLKRVPHARRSLLPGPHMPAMKRLTGRTSTPALVDGDDVVSGSTAILEHLERGFPEPRLIPEDPDERERAYAIVRHWDDEVGPALRVLKFHAVLEADYVLDTFARQSPALTRAAYRLAFPVIQRVMIRRMEIDDANAARARNVAREAFDFVAKEPGGAGYLVGDRFGIADLTCAALLMPFVSVSAWGGPQDAQTARNLAFLDEWRDHPGSEWVRTMYRRHRRPSDATP
jgi:glutathione S-transferase